MMIFLLFFAGNFQGFIDETQIFLLTLFRYAALTFMVTGLYNIIMNLIVIIRKRQFYSIRFIFTILGEILIIVIFLGISILLTAVNGS